MGGVPGGSSPAKASSRQRRSLQLSGLIAVARPLLAVPLLAAAPVTPSGGIELGFGWALVRMLLVLLAVCAVAYVLLRYGLRRFLAPRLAGRNVQVIERCPLSASRALWVVKVAQRCFLIGEAEGSISLLAELKRDELTTGPQQGKTSFLQLLRRGAGEAEPGEKGPPPVEGETSGDEGKRDER